MLFSSLPFLFMFLPLFFIVYFAFRKRYARNIVLLVFSLVFYAWGEPLYIFLMIFSICFNYVFARLIAAEERRSIRAKAYMAADTALNLLLIGIFKYAGFFVECINAVTGLVIPVPNIALPIGISFYTFQILSYVIDVYRGDVEVQKDIFMLGAYLSGFPQLIAGPIVRYQTIADELVDRRETLDEFAEGMRRFISGLAKKVLIANTMAEVADGILSHSAADYGIVGAWVAMLAYTMQIYYDFSGYSDMAIGMGRMMGFHYLENFDYPYISKSVTEFWRRWHISLSTFFRDYVYIPLGGNRVSRPRWMLNMLVVWSCTGLWHGASINFVIWGFYYCAILVFERLVWGKYIARIPAIGHIYTMACVIFGWVVFRAENLGMIAEITGAMVGGYGLGGAEIPASIVLQRSGFGVQFILMFAIAVVLSAPVSKLLKKKLEGLRIGAILTDVAAVGALLPCVIELAIGSYNPFIYFRF